MFEVKTGKHTGMRLVEFRLELSPGHSVAVAGTFNDWDASVNPLSFDLARDCYRAVVELSPGEYEYKFVIDGEWSLDEANTNFLANDFGTLNSVLTVS